MRSRGRLIVGTGCTAAQAALPAEGWPSGRQIGVTAPGFPHSEGCAAPS
jgi:hypothetical protein